MLDDKVASARLSGLPLLLWAVSDLLIDSHGEYQHEEIQGCAPAIKGGSSHF
jgi:hypothetical protein